MSRSSAGTECDIIGGMEKITTDISTFENLRKDGYMYVDEPLFSRL